MEQNKPPNPNKNQGSANLPPDAEASLIPSGEFMVEQHETPPAGPLDKQIHRRLPLPLVPPPSEPAKDEKQD
jgi:hypothetical protein